MKMVFVAAALLATCCGAYAQSKPTMSEAELKALVRDSLRFLDEKENKSREYSCKIRNQRKQFDSDGKLKSEESSVLLRTFEDGITVTHLIERNGKPLNADEKKAEQDRVARRVAELKAMSPSERDAMRKKSRRQDEWAREVPEALRFKVTGEDTIDGRRCWVLDAEPNLSYRPGNMQARVFEKMKGRFWVDKTDRELVRGEAETFDTVSIGLGLLARVEKGTRFGIHRIKLADGNWVVESQRLRFGARVMLLKWVANEIVTQMSDYRHKSQLSAAR